MHYVCTGLGNHVDDPTGGPAEFRGGSGCHYLKLFHGIERNIDRRALAAKLLSEEAIVVVAAIEAYVVEDTTLTGKGDFIAIRTLDDADAGREGQQVFKLSPQNRGRTYRGFIQGAA